MRLKSVLSLCRVSNLPTVWMNVIAASVLASQANQQPLAWGMVALLALALSAFYCGGMSLNDVCDYNWDKEHQTYRPIVSGKISLTQAKAVTVALFALGFALLWAAPYKAGLLAALALFAVIAIYNFWHKQNPASVLFMAGARALVFVVVALALSGTLPMWVLLAAMLQFGYTLSLTLVARHENTRAKPYNGPVIPRMIAAMALVDGALLAILAAPYWLLVGAALSLLTRFGQRYVRGD